MRVDSVEPAREGRRWKFGPACHRALVALCLLGTSRVSMAQNRVLITGATGEPLSGARVEVWNRDHRTFLLFSDELGNVFVPASSGTTSVIVRRLGFRPAVLRDLDSLPHQNIRLEPIALPLPARVVLARGNACDRREDPSARQLWRAVRTRYEAIPDGYGVAWRGSLDSGVVHASRVGDFGGLTLDSTGRLVGAGQIRSDRQRLAAGQYARAIATGAGNGRGGKHVWQTVPVEVYLSDHLLSDDFGAAHRFAHESSPSGVSLSFCPVGRHQGLRGELRLNGDSSINAASYVVQTGQRGAEPAVEVIFVSPSGTAGARDFLRPAQSVAWWPSAVGNDWLTQRRLAFSRFEVRSCGGNRC